MHPTNQNDAEPIRVIENIKPNNYTPQCPCCLTILTDEQVKTLWSDYTRSKKKIFPAGPGRPRIHDHSILCVCGIPAYKVRNRPNHRNPADGLPCRGIGFI